MARRIQNSSQDRDTYLHSSSLNVFFCRATSRHRGRSLPSSSLRSEEASVWLWKRGRDLAASKRLSLEAQFQGSNSVAVKRETPTCEKSLWQLLGTCWKMLEAALISGWAFWPWWMVGSSLFLRLAQEEFDALPSVCRHWSGAAPNQNMASLRSNVTEVATARGRKIVIHNCLTKADLRSLFISHMGFQFAQATGTPGFRIGWFFVDWGFCGGCRMMDEDMVIDLKVLVRSFNCESRACYVGSPRESSKTHARLLVSEWHLQIWTWVLPQLRKVGERRVCQDPTLAQNG